MVAIPSTVRIGASVIIEVQTPDGTKEYKSRLEDIEDNQLLIQVPTDRGQIVHISTNEYVTLQIATQSAVQMFSEGEVVAKRTDPFPMLVIRPISFESKQQRDFHRVQARIEPQAVWRWMGKVAPQVSGVAAQKVPTHGAMVDGTTVKSGAEDGNGSADGGDAAPAEEATDWWKAGDAAIVDISGGGLGLLSEENVPSGARLRLSFPLPLDEGKLEVGGQVMISRLRPARDRRDRTRFQLGVKFEDLNRPDQERLVRAIHRFQIEQRRRAQGHDR